MASEGNPKMTCTYCKCESEEMKVCTACYAVLYCNVECQRKDWNKHKSHCNFWYLHDLFNGTFLFWFWFNKVLKWGVKFVLFFFFCWLVIHFNRVSWRESQLLCLHSAAPATKPPNHTARRLSKSAAARAEFSVRFGISRERQVVEGWYFDLARRGFLGKFDPGVLWVPE